MESARERDDPRAVRINERSALRTAAAETAVATEPADVAWRREQVSRARDRFVMGLPVAREAERAFRYEGALGEGLWRMDSYSFHAPRRVEKLRRPDQDPGRLEALSFVMANRLNLKDEDIELAGRLLTYPDQKVATLLAGLHPKALRQTFEAGGPSALEIAILPQLIEASYVQHGRYESFSRVAALFGGPAKFELTRAAAAAIGAGS